MNSRTRSVLPPGTLAGAYDPQRASHRRVLPGERTPPKILYRRRLLTGFLIETRLRPKILYQPWFQVVGPARFELATS